MRDHSLLALLPLGLALAFGCSPRAEQPLPARLSSAVVDGYRSGATDDAVVFLRYLADVSEYRRICSATLVAPNLVLTALHCIADHRDVDFRCDLEGAPIPAGTGMLGAIAEPSQVQVYPGSCGIAPELPGDGAAGAAGAPAVPSCGSGTVEPAATGVQIVSLFARTYCLNDIAFVVLDRELSLPIAPLRLTGTVERGEVFSVVGYGGTALANDPGRHRRDGLRVRDLGLGVSDDFVGDVPPYQFTIEAGPCQGDSGGPTLAASGAVTGVASRIEGDCTTAFARPYYVAVHPYEQLVREAFAAAGHEPWLEGSPRPGSQPGGMAGAGGAAGAPATVTAGAAGTVPSGAGTAPTAGASGAPPSPPPPGEGDRGCCSAAVGPAPGGRGLALLLAALLFGRRATPRNTPARSRSRRACAP